MGGGGYPEAQQINYLCFYSYNMDFFEIHLILIVLSYIQKQFYSICFLNSIPLAFPIQFWMPHNPVLHYTAK